MTRDILRPRTFAIVAAGMLLSSGAYAFTASNTLPTTTAGAGSGAISGYDVTGVSYTMSTDPGSYSQASASNPMISSITFTLTQNNSSGTPATPANTSVVDAVITSTSSGVQPVNYSTCSAPSNSDVWTCSLVGTQAMSVHDATTLNVTASGNSNSIASAAGVGTEYNVSSSGTDASGCGPVSDPCGTIQYAVNEASPGDTINVEAGKYANSSTSPLVTVNKALTFIGNNSTITGTGPSFLLGSTSAGVTGVTIEGFDFSGITGSGYNGVITVPGYGAGDVVIQNNTFNTTTDEAIGYHGNPGLTAPLGTGFSILNNTITNVTGNSGSPRSGMWIGNLSNSVIAGNTITTTAYDGIALTGAGQGDEQNNAVYDNTVSSVPVAGIQVAFGNNDQVVGNTVSDAGNSTIASGPVSGRNCAICLYNTSQTSITVKSNSVTGSYQGIGVGQSTASPGALESGIVISFNNIVNDPPSSSPAGGAGLVDNATSGTLDAVDNWWGCNAGPNTSGCTSIIDTSGSSVNATPFLVLSVTASQTSITTASGSSSTITASLTQNSAGSNTTSQGMLPNGISVGFSTNLGTVSPATATTTNGTASSTLTSTTTGTATVTVTVAGQSVKVTVAVS
ncbi:MAG: NosD domain-containing protein [Acidimicrobiales bacterium]